MKSVCSYLLTIFSPYLHSNLYIHKFEFLGGFKVKSNKFFRFKLITSINLLIIVLVVCLFVCYLLKKSINVTFNQTKSFNFCYSCSKNSIVLALFFKSFLLFVAKRTKRKDLDKN